MEERAIARQQRLLAGRKGGVVALFPRLWLRHGPGFPLEHEAPGLLQRDWGRSLGCGCQERARQGVLARCLWLFLAWCQTGLHRGQGLHHGLQGRPETAERQEHQRRYGNTLAMRGHEAAQLHGRRRGRDA